MQAHPDMQRSITVLPVPKDVDPHVLVWKGASVLGKMDGVADLWLTAADWVRLLLVSQMLNHTHNTHRIY